MDKRIQILCRRRDSEGAGLLGVATKLLQEFFKPSLLPEHLSEIGKPHFQTSLGSCTKLIARLDFKARQKDFSPW